VPALVVTTDGMLMMGRMAHMRILLCAVVVGCAACSGSPGGPSTTSSSGSTSSGGGTSGGSTSGGSSSGGTSGGSTGGGLDGGTVGGGLVAARPYALMVPTGYHASTAVPLLILLHGYGASGAIEEGYLKLGPLAEAQTFLYATPNGTVDQGGRRFWNATDACCNLYGSSVDDVAYLGAVIDDVQSKYNVDSKRIYFVGHSNGGFMAHRLACELSPRIAGIVSLAGAQWENLSRCMPTDRVAVLEIHGTADATIPYDGGAIGQSPFPSAPVTISDWAALNGCGAIDNSAPNLDIESALPGAETSVTSYDNCPGGAAVLWTINGGSHIPSLQPTWPSVIYGFLSAHPKQ